MSKYPQLQAITHVSTYSPPLQISRSSDALMLAGLTSRHRSRGFLRVYSPAQESQEAAKLLGCSELL